MSGRVDRRGASDDRRDAAPASGRVDRPGASDDGRDAAPASGRVDRPGASDDRRDAAPASGRATRRGALAAGGIAAGGALAAAWLARGRPSEPGGPGGDVPAGSSTGTVSDRPARVTVPAAPGLPAAQHAWDATLRRDEHGNALLPRHHRLLLLDLAREPDAAGAAQVENALRRLERRHAHGPDGLLTLLAWGPAYFAVIGAPSPVPPAVPLDADELPEIDDAAALLILASDHERLLDAAERELVGTDASDGAAAGASGGGAAGASGSGGAGTSGSAAGTSGAGAAGTSGSGAAGTSGGGASGGAFAGVLRLRERRTGFAGAGLPARAQRRGGGLGLARPIAAEAPLFMGFKSGLRRNQASEEDVTIAAGPLAGGTTLHLSAIALELRSWYELSERDRVARMYAPQVTPAQATRFTDDAPAPRESVARTATRHGRVGHVQALATVRRDGRPLILRRDVNTLDDGGPGLHFVALQRSVDDFVATRRAMTAARSRAAPQLTGQLNNGINEWMRVTRRANFAVPPRRARAFPLLEEVDRG
ncbi:DUF7405 family protein [Conexibacter arvalis]|uniref:Tat pathway signal protein n=1 Tax=Conexibacter arvalis TaxID=912552 RepID=A0A840IF44_9ACTN|nr:Tat pathway signal protein [Conexibacter arvalis]MBB4663472.1 hypothetical protein [Conexibacter arvalis]